MRYRALVLTGKRSVSVETRETKPLEAGWVRVRVSAGGICGSDLHYYQDFGNVGFTLRNPVIMGHEASGVVDETGPGVDDLNPGDKVAINPMMNCGHCLPCRSGRINLCVRKRFPCSAAIYPHVDGFFREYVDVEARQCLRVSPDMDLVRLAFAEPLACVLHAVGTLGNLTGKAVLVTGAGPIGIFAVAVAKLRGAGKVVITDIVDEPLAIATKMGAERAVNSSREPFREECAANGGFDAAIEASGSPKATVDCMHALRKGGEMVQLGTSPGGDMAVPWVMFQSKEINVYGTSQFCSEFDTAVSLLENGGIDPMPMYTGAYSLEEADAAFAAAGDRRGSMKIQFAP